MTKPKKNLLLNHEFDMIEIDEIKNFNFEQAKTLIKSLEVLSSLNDTSCLSQLFKKNPLTSIIDALNQHEKEKNSQHVIKHLSDALALGNYETQKVILDEIFKDSHIYYNNYQYFENMITAFEKIIFPLNSPSLMKAYAVSFQKFLDNEPELYQKNKELIDDLFDFTYLMNKSLEYSSYNNINYLLSNPTVVEYIKQKDDYILSYSVKYYLEGLLVHNLETTKQSNKTALDEHIENQTWQAIIKSMDAMFYDCELKNAVNEGIKQTAANLSSYGSNEYSTKMFKEFLIRGYVDLKDSVKKGYGSSSFTKTFDSIIQFDDKTLNQIKKEREIFLVDLERQNMEKVLSKNLERKGNKLKI